MTTAEKMLNRLLKDFGYAFAGGRVTCKGIRGFTSDRVLPYRFTDLYDAAECLRLIIGDGEYSERHTRIVSGKVVKR